MSSDEIPKNDSDKSDPRSYQDSVRLKAFLRKAVAIIAAERGLNARSRLKLESLGKHQKLPDHLFAEAIRQLQESNVPVPPLTRYEQEFVKYLVRDFQKLKGDLLSLGMEQNAIDIAGRKFQIAPARAEQLIEQQAELASLGRISRSDAEKYGTQFISERIGDQLEITEDFHDELYKSGHKFGLSRDRVDAEILRLLELNRLARIPRPKSVWIATVMLVLAGILAIGYYIGWPQSKARTDPGKNEVEPVPTNVTSPVPSFPAWISKSNGDVLVDLIGRAEISTALSSQLLDSDPEIRKIGYRLLVDKISGEPLADRKSLEDLTCNLFYEDPDNQSAFEIIDSTCQHVRLADFRLNASIDTFQRQMRANRLLGLVYYSLVRPSENPNDVGNRKQELSVRIKNVTGISPENLLLTEYIQQSESVIAVDQWNYLVQNGWSSPNRAALLIQPVCDMTRSQLSTGSLNRFRWRLLQSILEIDASQWNYLKQPIRESISSCDEGELIEWIALFQSAGNPEFREFVGPLLINKASIELPSSGLVDSGEVLNKFIDQYRNRILQPLQRRDEKIAKATNDLLESLSVGGQTRTPDQIAQVAFETNVNLAFCQQIRRGDIGHDQDFVAIDEMLARPKIRLRELVSLPGKGVSNQALPAPMASDINRKQEALEKIANLAPHLRSTRIQALTQLESVAPRFDDINYDEAEILARYFLAELSVEEALNIQRLISSFAHWPTLGLSMTDQVSSTNVKLDNALTMARLLLKKDFEVEAGVDDRAAALRVQMLQTISDRIDIRLGEDSADLSSDWDRLRLFLNGIYRERFSLIFDTAGNVDMSVIGTDAKPSDYLFLIIDRQLEVPPSQMEEFRRIDRGKSLIRLGEYNELEKTIMANQLILELLAVEGSKLPAKDAEAIGRLAEQFELVFQQSVGLGEQLFLVNRELLLISSLLRQAMIQNTIRKK